jgi:RNA polymerase sigma factor (sigma-70 family)
MPEEPASFTDRIGEPAPQEHAENWVAIRGVILDLYANEYHQVMRFLMGCSASEEDAQDATQEAFLQIWIAAKTPGAWEKIQGARGWIRSVAYKLLLRPPGPRRRLLTSPMADVPDMPVPTLDPAELTAQTRWVLHTLQTLEQETRLVMAFHMDGFSSVEIARHLGVDDQKVRDLLKKARKILSARLAAAREEEGRWSR